MKRNKKERKGGGWIRTSFQGAMKVRSSLVTVWMSMVLTCTNNTSFNQPLSLALPEPAQQQAPHAPHHNTYYAAPTKCEELLIVCGGEHAACFGTFKTKQGVPWRERKKGERESKGSERARRNLARLGANLIRVDSVDEGFGDGDLLDTAHVKPIHIVPKVYLFVLVLRVLNTTHVHDGLQPHKIQPHTRPHMSATAPMSKKSEARQHGA
jgi:hypothetical protein